ncbi:ScyD/ScyE family protein [Arthrobacter sp. H14-L1]|uniref:ScyD/ScyE family protein n=1 Tax=Arthrobacter sp. H14-L1 TaxID=2996697 RepID=UPI0022722C3B|nr:ScyD/ScyE family protein [Arthrobacter sp. H14-L1]MCY0904685.1 ScyD/ScyE family protein [Arthrobacter sp. H14-L1]
MRRIVIRVSAVVALTALVGLGAGPVHAAGNNPIPVPGTPETLASGLLTPLSLSVGSSKSVYFTQNFAGSLNKVDAKGAVSTVYQASVPGHEIGAVSSRFGMTYFAENAGAGQAPAPNIGIIKSISSTGKVRSIADVAQYEATHNPDGNVTYGFRDLDAACLAQIPAALPGSYTGLADSHPYATEPGLFEIYVADAGGNDIVAVNQFTGRVRTVAVLPPSITHVTAAVATSFGLPACAVGHDYYFEPVPTDVRWGRDGWLYVSTLPGGPEGAALGARGSVYKVSPWSSTVRLVASGLNAPTGLALSRSGDIYVAELFGGQISVIQRGTSTAKPFLAVPLPADVAIHGGTLYATVHALPGNGTPPAGQVIKVRLNTGEDNYPSLNQYDD